MVEIRFSRVLGSLNPLLTSDLGSEIIWQSLESRGLFLKNQNKCLLRILKLILNTRFIGVKNENIIKFSSLFTSISNCIKNTFKKKSQKLSFTINKQVFFLYQIPAFH